jgi:hypothetical protein
MRRLYSVVLAVEVIGVERALVIADHFPADAIAGMPVKVAAVPRGEAMTVEFLMKLTEMVGGDITESFNEPRG